MPRYGRHHLKECTHPKLQIKKLQYISTLNNSTTEKVKQQTNKKKTLKNQEHKQKKPQANKSDSTVKKQRQTNQS